MSIISAESLSFKTQYFSLPKLQMHAAVAGPADGPLLILLHGFPEYWYSWRKQLGPLAQAGYRVVAPDQRGYNLTDKTPPYDGLTLAKDVVDLIHACGEQRAYVVGHDWGAVVAWVLAGAYPDSVKKLAILNVPHPASLARALGGGNLRQMLKSWYIFFFQIPRLPEWLLSRNNFAAMRRLMTTSALPGTFTNEDLDHYQAAWAQPGALSATLGWYRALIQQTLRQPANQKLIRTRIRVPTLIVWGEQDRALQVELATESLQWVEAGRLVRFPDATHWVNEDKPAEVTRLLLDHFS